MKKLEIPFRVMTQERARHCGQFVLQLALEYLREPKEDEELTIDDLVTMTGKPPGGITLTLGLAYAALQVPRIEAKLVTLSANLVTGRLEEFVELSNQPLDDLKQSYQELKEKALAAGLVLEERRPSIQEIEHALDEDAVPIVVVDWGKLRGTAQFLPHFVIVTGIDDSRVTMHHVGPWKPTPHKLVSKSLFLEAWEAEGTDMDTLILARR